MKSNKFWIVILGVVLVASAATAFLLRQKPADRADIFQDGVLIGSYDLSAPAEAYTIVVTSGSKENIVCIDHGRVCISDANCPDKLCVRQGWISSGAAPVVCLPNRVVIRLESSAAPDVDAVVG